MSLNAQNDFNFNGYVPYIKDEGAGFSDEDLVLCFRLLEETRPVILQALDEVPCDGESTFTIGDYATGDGNSSMGIFREIVELPEEMETEMLLPDLTMDGRIRTLRSRYGDELPIQVLYEDQPMNDYKSLVRRITGNLPNADPSFIKEFVNVYPLISPTNFHEVCIAPESLDLGFSLSSMQYLSTLPCKITGGTHSTQITDSTEKVQIRDHAAQEWESMLKNRAVELKKGGHFVIEAMGMDNQGRYSGNYLSKVDMFANFTRVWKKMELEGLINEEEFLNTNNLHYLRTEEEFRAPFDDPNSAVYKMGLRLISCKIKYVLCPQHERWIREEKKDDSQAKREQARRFVSSIRYWINWVFMAGLSTQRPLLEREQIVDILFQRIEDNVADSPDDHAYNFVLGLVHFKKV